MVASRARIKFSGITKVAGEILNQPDLEMIPNIRQELRSAQQTLANIETSLSGADFKDVSSLLLLRDYTALLTNLVLPFSRAVKK